ncbi:MAG TPA: hypothetical protein ENJ53_06365, partial [Phaeodactylibacter sp.]|nr:hypothetical protein [Phaeodactylibacter sp.]
MENKDFDQFIKKSLENLDGAAYVPMDWSLMDDKLGMDGLDDLMKESLGDLEGQEYAPMNWSLMADKLDAEIGADTHAELDTALSTQMEDIYLDAVAYDHLENLKPPYNKEHWKIMEARLDEEYAYRRKVMITKIMEAAIVLLLVWTAINFFPNKKNTVTPQPSPVANSQENVNNFDKKYFPNNLISKNTTTPNSSEEAKTEKNIENNQKLLASGSQDLEPLSPIVIPP